MRYLLGCGAKVQFGMNVGTPNERSIYAMASVTCAYIQLQAQHTIKQTESK